MVSGKKILKRTLGGLKMIGAWAPIALVAGSGLSFLGTGISAIVYGSKLGNYMDTPIFQQEYLKDSDEYRRQLDEGEIEFSEYMEKIEDMSESSYQKSVLKRDIEGNEPWQELLKTYNTLGIAALSLLGATAATGIWTWIWLGTDIKDDIEWSARDDFDWEPPKKEKKPEPVVKVEEKKREDISSDEQELGSLDDYLVNLQG